MDQDLQSIAAPKGEKSAPRSREYDPVKATTDDVSVLGDAFKGLVSGVVIGVPEGLATLLLACTTISQMMIR